jgi:hypothetical protein
MENNKPVEVNNWGTWVINKIIHPFTVFATPLFILFLMIYLIYFSFREGVYPGIRSFTGVLFPLIIVTFIFAFRKELLEKLGRINTLFSFIISLIIGMVVMLVVRFLAFFSPIPITELVLSGSFSILLFSYVNLRENKMLSYYYGMISGFLLYIILWGFPVLK